MLEKSTGWMTEIFQTSKPVIAMAHLPALPNTPRYDDVGGLGAIIKKVKKDIEILTQEGVDAVMFSNEDDRPYVLEAGIEQIAAMTRVVTECRPLTIPFGVDFLWDPLASLAIAHATGASFVREVLTGLYESDMGIWTPKAGKVLRLRKQLGAQHIKMMFNIVPEFGTPLGIRTNAQRARSVVMSSLPDAILVSGPMAGHEPDLGVIKEIKQSIDEVPVLLNTGAKAENVAEYLSIADGVIVGSYMKIDGCTWNNVDPDRVDTFMKVVRSVREKSNAA